MELSFVLGICFSIILFLIEYLSHGALSKAYRNTFQPDSQQYFYLYMLDRGCALLSLSSWVIIGILIKYKKHLLAVIFYISVLYLLSISDSLASFLGFIVGGLAFCICKLLTVKLLRFISSALVLGSLVMPILAYNINPRAISDQYVDVLPISNIHRIFIWHFVTNKAIDKPIFGWGFGTSRKFKINNNEMVQYKSHFLSPLPLHPHNNILQIWFETGFVGLVLFLLLIYKYSKNIVQIIITGRETLNSEAINFGVVSYACFINYYLIGMISFGIWQLWWVSSGIWLVLMMSLLVKPKQNRRDNV
jgi:O-antigen ligase